MGLIRFYVWVIRIAITLALCGQLKACTLIMLDMAAEKSSRGIMSYSSYSKKLTQ